MQHIKRRMGWLVIGIVCLASAGSRLIAQAAPSATNVCGTLGAQQTTWTLANSPYSVCNTFSVTVPQGGTLTIEPGVEVRFDAGAELYVYGQLSASGAPTLPITFTGSTATPGSWNGLQFYGTTTQTNRSELSYVTIEYGGSGASGGAIYLDATAISVKHSLIRHGAGHGVYGWSNGSANISDTRFENNTGYAVLFVDGTVNPVLAELSASGNGVDGVALGGFAYLTGSHVWEYTGLPYVVRNGLEIRAGSTLVIEPNVEVRFEQNQALNVSGQLQALGVPSNPITFTGTTKTLGWWKGLQVLGTAAVPGVANLDYVMIEYGGQSPSGANLSISGGQAIVKHSLIQLGQNDGVRITSSSGTSIQGSRIISHTQYGLRNLSPTRPVLASANWWGAASGPLSDAGCGGGTGSRVSTGSIFRPVLTDALATPPTLLLSQAAHLTLTPRRWFAPADGIARIYFDITLRDGNGTPLSGRAVIVNTTLGNMVSGGITDASGKTLAYLSSTTVGDAEVTARLDQVTACEETTVPSAKVTFTPSVTDLDLLPNGAAPYLNSDLEVSPLPVIRGVTTTLSARLTNPLTVPLTVDVSFEFRQAGIGLVFGPLAEINGQVIPPNGSVKVSVPWTPLVSGDYCVQLRYSIVGIGNRVIRPTAGSGYRQMNLKTFGGPGGPPPEKDGLKKTRKSLNAVNSFTDNAYDTDPFGIPLALVNHHIEWMLNKAEEIAQALGDDPPRQDYNQIAQPQKLSMPPVVPNAQVPPARAAAINAMADALAEVNAYGVAAQITLDRYGGASAAKDLAWASVQTSAYLEYKRLMGTAAITASERISDLLGIAAQEGITSVIVPPDRIIASQQQLSTTGFTAQQIVDAHAAGLSDEEIEAVRQSIITADPLELSRENDVVVKMQELSERLRTLGYAILYPQMFAPSISIGGGKLLRAEGTYGNTMAQVFESRTTILLGNPLTQTATIDVSARRVDLPADWLISVSPAQAQLAPGEELSVTISIVPGAPVPQGSVPRVAIEGYAGSTLLGGVVLDVLVPNYVPFGMRTVYLPLIKR
jgi:hypothetical protein